MHGMSLYISVMRDFTLREMEKFVAFSYVVL